MKVIPAVDIRNHNVPLCVYHPQSTQLSSDVGLPYLGAAGVEAFSAFSFSVGFLRLGRRGLKIHWETKTSPN